MVQRMSRQITRSLVNNDIIDFDDVTIYQYGLEVMFISLIEIAGLLLVGMAMGRADEAIIFMISFSTLRLYAGGYHADSVFKCFALILSFMLVDIYLCRVLSIENYPWLSVAILVASTILVHKYSPVSVVTRPVSEDERVSFRRKSIQIVLLFLILGVGIAVLDIKTKYLGLFALGVFLEAVTLPLELYRKEIGK